MKKIEKKLINLGFDLEVDGTEERFVKHIELGEHILFVYIDRDDIDPKDIRNIPVDLFICVNGRNYYECVSLNRIVKNPYDLDIYENKNLNADYKKHILNEMSKIALKFYENLMEEK